MRLVTMRMPFLASCIVLQIICLQPAEMQLNILSGIGHITQSANNIMSSVMQRPKALLHRIADRAANYIHNAIQTPVNILQNATSLTAGLINSAASTGLDIPLRKILEKIRRDMRTGVPQLDIPVLDPLEIDQINFTTNNTDLGKISLEIQNLIVEGLSNFTVNEARVSLMGPALSVNVTCKVLHIEGDYNITGDIGDLFDVRGHDSFTAIAHYFTVYINATIGISNRLYLRSFNLDYDLRSLELYLNNLKEDPQMQEVLNKITHDLTPEVIRLTKKDVLPTIEENIGEIVNNTLYRLNVNDVIHLLLKPPLS